MAEGGSQIDPLVAISFGIAFLVLAACFIFNISGCAARSYESSMRNAGDYRPWGIFSRRPPSLLGFRITFASVAGFFGCVLLYCGIDSLVR